MGWIEMMKRQNGYRRFTFIGGVPTPPPPIGVI
jgi:hypothetical protein